MTIRHPLGHLLVLLAIAIAPLQAADLKVACVGNSLTAGYGLPNAYLESYPSRLDSLLGDGYAVTNYGVSSQTMLKGTNASYWKTSSLGAALAYLPDIVVIELGTNDAKDDYWPSLSGHFKIDYDSMIDTFQTISSHAAVWATLQPRANNPGWRMFDTVIADRVNPLILEAALETGAGVIDLRTHFKGHPEWMQDDSVHPNAIGALELAKAVAGMLKRSPLAIAASGSELVAPDGHGWRWYRNDSLLADSGRTLSTVLPGTYKVSVRIDSATQSRQVTQAYVVAAPVDISRAQGSQGIRVWCDAIGAVHVEGAPATARLHVWNALGGEIRSSRMPPGMHAYALWDSGKLLRQGLLTTLP